MSLESALLTFGLVVLSELGDKSQLVTFSFAAEGGSVVELFVGVILGLGAVTMLGVVGGSVLYLLLPPFITGIVVTIVFLLMGIHILLTTAKEPVDTTVSQTERDDNSENTTSSLPSSANRVFRVASTLFLMEWGDRTQLMIIALVATSLMPFVTGLAGFAGLLVVNGISIIIGNKIGNRVPTKTLRWLAGGLFLAFGVFSALQLFFL